MKRKFATKQYSGESDGVMIGIDLGDKCGQYYTLDKARVNIDAGRVMLQPRGLEKRFRKMGPRRCARLN